MLFVFQIVRHLLREGLQYVKTHDSWAHAPAFADVLTRTVMSVETCQDYGLEFQVSAIYLDELERAADDKVSDAYTEGEIEREGVCVSLCVCV